MIDVAIAGAGPIGIEAAILASRQGLEVTVFEKGCVTNAVAGYPTYMTFFTTSERLEVGGHPLVTATDKPTRKEALDYYRKVVHNEGLAVRTYTEVIAIERRSEGFQVRLRRTAADHTETTVEARRVMVATGYFDNPKPLNVPGETLPNVTHYYKEAHPYYGRRVTIIGAGSSAADAALDLHRAGAIVTLVHRGSDFRKSLKYWIRPNLENRVKEGSVTALFNSVVEAIHPDRVSVVTGGAREDVPTDQTFILTGYYAPPELLAGAGVHIHPETLAAEVDPDTFESNVPGLYVIGSAACGLRTSDVFIENGLLHAHKAMADVAAQGSRGKSLHPTLR